jgi:tRNA pseudouridine55 synthase
LLRYLGELPKTYAATGRLGEETDTLDADGELVRTAPVEVSLADAERACATLVGDSMQAPPAYSAVKVGGRKLYEAARKGDVLEARARPIRVDTFQVTGFDGRDLEVLITCSGGTYVRVLVADVGRGLGCGAHLVRLRRTAIGSFLVEDARPPGAATPEPIERAVEHLPSIHVETEEAAAVTHGRILGPTGIEGPYAVFGPDGALKGIYRDDGAKARPEVVLASG